MALKPRRNFVKVARHRTVRHRQKRRYGEKFHRLIGGKQAADNDFAPLFRRVADFRSFYVSDSVPQGQKPFRSTLDGKPRAGFSDEFQIMLPEKFFNVVKLAGYRLGADAEHGGNLRRGYILFVTLGQNLRDGNGSGREIFHGISPKNGGDGGKNFAV